MNTQTLIEAPPDVVPFNAYKAWEEECERRRLLTVKLRDALMLLEMEGARRDREGRDSLALTSFVRETRREVFS